MPILSIMTGIFLLAFCGLVFKRYVFDNTRESPPGKLIYLDGLRGVAALVVVVFHFFLNWYPAIPSGNPALAHSPLEPFLPLTPLYALYSGSLAVAIFFVMSGFVLSYPFFRNNNREIPVSGALRRYIRLGVPVLATSLLYYAFLKLDFLSLNVLAQLGDITHDGGIHLLYAFHPGFWDVLQHALVQVFFAGEFKYNPVLWTMKVEFFGSLLVFSLCFLFGKSRHRGWVYLLLTPLLLRAEYWAFVAGMALCDVWISNRLTLTRHLQQGVFLLGIYLGAYPYFLNTVYRAESPLYGWTEAIPYLNDRQRGWLLLVLGAACLLTVLLNSKKAKAFFSTPVCRYLGEISFSLYLTHLAIQLSLTPRLFLMLYPIAPSYHVAAWGSFLLGLPVVLAVATLTYHWVERPSIALGKSVYQYLKRWALRLYQRLVSPLKTPHTVKGRLADKENHPLAKVPPHPFLPVGKLE